MNPLTAQAQQILRDNDRGGFTIPTNRLYPFQWLWDAGFTALGWMEFDEARAWQELEYVFGGQWPNGMLPHIIFHRHEPTYFPGPDVWGAPHQPASSAVTQPPVIAWCVRVMLEQARDRALAEDKARSLYPKLLAYHRWFKRERDPHNTGRVGTFHPWETGADNSAAWDKALGRVPVNPNLKPYVRRDTNHVDASQRPRQAEYDRYLSLLEEYKAVGFDQLRLYADCSFRVEDIGINSVLHRANRDLLWLSERLGFGDAQEIEGWLERSRAGIEQLWDETAGLYYGRDCVADEPIRVGISGAFLPLFAGTPDRARAERLVRTLETWAEKVRYLVPSTDPGSPAFESRRYWRGPVWPVVNYLIATGLKDYGHADLAERIRLDTLKLIQSSSFAEYFDPTTAEGLGGGHFSWTAAMILHWAKP